MTNTGWMIPYVACMLVATGMLAQFSITLLRFVRRRDGEERCACPRYPRYGLFIRAYEAIVAHVTRPRPRPRSRQAQRCR